MNWIDFVAVAIPILVGVGGVFAGLVRYLFKHLDERFAKLEKAWDGHRDEAHQARDEARQEIQAVRDEAREEIQALHRELANFKLYVANNCVSQTEWVRVEGGREITLRKLHDEINELKLLIHAWNQ